MPNGECYVGAENRTDIKALNKGYILLSTRIDKIEAKQDWILYLIIANLAAFIIDKVL